MFSKIFKRERLMSRGIIGYILAFAGILALAFSTAYVSPIERARTLAFIGLGLTFWGFLLLYLKRERYVKSTLLDSTATASLEALSKIITELDYKGKAVYLPPKYLKDFKSGILYIPKKQEVEIPTVGEVAEEKTFSKNPNGLCIAPPGLNLTNLFEEELGTDFVRADLRYLQDNLPKILVEKLEIVQDVEISIEGNLVQVRLLDSVYGDYCREKRFSNICNSIGCPLCSSIACALSRATGRSVIIEKNDYSENGKTINVRYRILEE